MPCRDPIETTAQTLAKTIGFLPFQARTYADSTFLTSNLHDSVREILKQTQYGTTDEIYCDVIARGDLPSNSLASGFQQNRQPRWLHLDGPSQFSEPYTTAYELYLALLVFRKQFGAIVRDQMTAARNSAPSDDEWLQELRLLKGRHEIRALDAAAHVADSSYYLDDQLVASVVVNSILAGSDCVILTRCRAVQQQFISLVIQLELHYRAWCLANHDSQPRPSGEASKTDDGLTKLGFKQPLQTRAVSRNYVDECLPVEPLDVQLQCWLIEGDGDDVIFEPVAFLAERPMHAMLYTRGVTGGLTTELLGADDLAFFWTLEDGQLMGHVLRGESSWTKIGSESLPKDSRISLRINRVPTKDLVSIANFCDFPESQSSWIRPNSAKSELHPG